MDKKGMLDLGVRLLSCSGQDGGGQSQIWSGRGMNDHEQVSNR